MMNTGSICRIGVFYDGSFFTYAQQYFYHERQLGWLSFQQLHNLFETYLRHEEQGYYKYKVVYAAWHQGLFTSKNATEDQLRHQRNLYQDLMHAGIEAKYLPMSQNGAEKGVDVAMAVDALQIGLSGKIDVAFLVTGDGDFVPLVRALNKEGIRVVGAFFEFEDNQGKKSFMNDRLSTVCNYTLDITKLKDDKDYEILFKNLFRKQSDI